MVSISSSTWPSAATAASISCSVVLWEREKRTAQCASRALFPIAVRTCVGSGEPDLHAEPEESDTPY